jgi:hypothetical protein
MVMTNELLLFKNNEFLPFLVNFLTMAKSELNLLVLEYLNCTRTRLPVKFLLEHIRLQVSEFLQALLCAFYH